MDQTSKAARLRELHVPGDPLVLPNAWDASSAKTLEAAGFGALATSSSAVAGSLGYADGEATPPDEMFAAIARIVRVVEVPLTADIERGYGLEPAEIVDRLIGAGAVGCNLEDSFASSGELVPADEHAAWLGQVRSAAESAGVPVVLNARIDTHLHKAGAADERTEEAIRRGRLYLSAGADCVYPIFLNEPHELRRFVEEVAGPVNVVFLPKSSIADLTSLGVARISFGGGLHMAANAWLKDAAGKIAEGQSPY